MIGKELSRLPKDGTEAKPLRSGFKNANYSGQKDEADVMATGFALRDIAPQAVKAWLALQLVSLLFEFNLWREVTSHLADYEDVVARECSSRHRLHGVCAGASWNASIFEDFVLNGHQTHSFSFSTHSTPPTFLIAVHPVSSSPASIPAPQEIPQEAEDWENHDESHAHWSIEVQRLQPAGRVPPLRFARTGRQVITAEDLSEEAAHAASGVQWRATVQSLGFYRRNVRMVVFVEDAVSQQLLAVHQHPRCSFGTSWKAFNQQHQGQSHRALARCQWLLGVFLLIGGTSVYLVHRELETHRAAPAAGGEPLRRFHWVVLGKFLLQDVPQQICFVLYIFGWYEAGGLRCQLCLFDAKHCSDEDALHFSNIITAGCILLSSLANQLLVRPVRKRRYTEDDVCMHLWIRVGGTCVATVPFTTGLCLSSRSLVSEPALVHLLFAVPCLLGWLSISGFCCLGLLIACDDEI